MLSPGTRLGNYQIISGIGAGGMGEVYRAHDTVLHREVALKLVHPDFCHHPDSLSRLRREARALAALNHPNVATLHELAEFGGSCGLVMELVSGETLADTLRRGPVTGGEALRLGTQIAAALEAAHERGVIHRDLKPANIKITTDGYVKVLDFGLARRDSDNPDAALHSTLVTTSGTVLGTAPYMSPEQARGAPVDRRTDVWAFGCVLYEMLTGRLAFDGGSRSDIIAAILEREPDWSALPPDTPPHVRRLLQRCLQKDVRRRFRDIGDVRLELEEPPAIEGVAGVPPGGTAGRITWMRAAAWVAAGAALGGLAVIAWRPLPSAVATEVKFSIALPDDERLAATALSAVAMAPDGRSVVYAASRGATTQLLRRTLDSATASVLQGTFGAVSPFFSPDGQWVAFFADGRLKKVPAGGGPPVVICDAADGLGGSWSTSGTIVFAAATGAALQRVSADGGVASRATELDVGRGEFSHRWPEALPGGDTILFTVGTVGEWDEAAIVAYSLSSGRRTEVLKGGTNPRYLSSGHLAYAHDGAIWIAAFDAQRLAVTGKPVRALERVATTVDGAAQFAVSPSGAMVYQPAFSAAARRLVVVDGNEQTPLAAPLHAYVTPRLSPDGRRVLLGVADNAEHVWSYELATGALTQLTFEAANRAPIWSADGQRMTFASTLHGALNLFVVPANGEGSAERLAPSESLQIPGSWSPDGQTLAFMEQHSSTGRDIMLLGRGGDRVAFMNTTADESAPRFSPDGRWIAYVSNESGQPQVYLRPTSPAAAARRVSVTGGTEPVWRRDGGALYYRSEGRLLAAPLAGGTPQPSRVVLAAAGEPGTFDAAGYDVMSGNERFLMITSASPATALSELRVVLNWMPVSPSSR
ncbi:MAG: protein kinase [Acidobacteriota bacterium]|nr:protein kinase [Acidobacteriota bacterium]